MKTPNIVAPNMGRLGYPMSRLSAAPDCRQPKPACIPAQSMQPQPGARKDRAHGTLESESKGMGVSCKRSGTARKTPIANASKRASVSVGSIPTSRTFTSATQHE